MKKKLFCLICILMIFFALFYSAFGSETNKFEQYRAKVIKTEMTIHNEVRTLHINAQLVEGPYKGQTISFEHFPIKGTRSDVILKKGMHIIVGLKITSNEIVSVNLVDIDRSRPLKLLTFSFALLLSIFGGFRGIRSGIALLSSFLLIIYVLIPQIIKGHDPIWVSIIVSSMIIFISFILISGFNKKSQCAILGTIGGTIFAGIFAFYFGNLMALSGVSDEHLQTLVAYSDIVINYRGLLFSGIIVGTIGAIMDVSMSVVSFIFEIKSRHPATSSLSLFAAGLNVGKDMMATMTITLILAYAGASLPLFLLFNFLDLSFSDIIAIEFIAEEILRSLCGSIGLILTIPLSSLIASIKA